MWMLHGKTKKWQPAKLQARVPIRIVPAGLVKDVHQYNSSVKVEIEALVTAKVILCRLWIIFIFRRTFDQDAIFSCYLKNITFH